MFQKFAVGSILLLVVFCSRSTAQPPTVGGKQATVYVNNGSVVGGLLNGFPYFGVLIGTAGDDVIAGTSRRDIIYGRNGADVISGFGGNDLIFGDNGDDRLDGEAGFDIAFGGRGTDTCTPETELKFSCEESGPLAVGPDFNWYVDPADTRLLIVRNLDGSVVEYFGRRDPSGVVTSVTSGIVTDVTGAITRIFFDADGLPTNIITPDNFSFGFSFVTDRKFVLSVTTPGGAGQANVLIDLDNLEETAASPSPAAKLAVNSVSGNPRKGALQLLAFNGATALKAASPAIAATDQFVVNVNRCGQPEDDAGVYVRLDSGSTSQIFQANSVGGGRYAVDLPTTNVDPSAFGDICNSIVDNIGQSCLAFDNLPPGSEIQICAAVAAPFLATPVPGIDEAAVFAACEIAINAGRLYCSTFGASPAPGAPSVANAICDTFDAAIDWFLEDEVDITATAVFPGQPSQSASADGIPASGPFPDLNIDLGGEPEITSFTTSPVDPGPFQSYVATARLSCLPPNARVFISISGTDGYSDSTSCVFTDVQGTCLLSVPGAEADVVDTITVTIEDGPSRIITLVF